MYDAFLGSILGASMRSSEDSRYCRVSALNEGADLPTPPAYALQRTSVCARALRFRVTPYINAVRWYGNVGTDNQDVGLEAAIHSKSA